MTGSSEKQLSDLGKVSHWSYWTSIFVWLALNETLLGFNNHLQGTTDTNQASGHIPESGNNLLLSVASCNLCAIADPGKSWTTLVPGTRNHRQL